MASSASGMAAPAPAAFMVHRGFITLACLLILFGVGWDTLGLSWAKVYPDEWTIPAAQVLTRFVTWLQEDATLGFMSVKDFTRLVGDVLNFPVLLLKGLLVSGFELDANATPALRLPPLSWVGVSLVPALVCLWLGKGRLAAVSLLSFLYVAFFGLWESTMLTVASVAVSVVLGVLIGVVLGIGAYRSRALDMVIMPTLDFMQTMPVFAYLVPALVMFGYGPAAALVVTLIYAIPPMAKITKVSLSRVTPEVLELSKMAGCTRAQTMWRVMLPTIRPSLMVGVNQVIMLTLNMVIIGSLIGAGGLGYDVWQSLKALRIGEGTEAGIAITLLAIVLDRISQEVASRRPIHTAAARPFLTRHGPLVPIVAVLALTTALGMFVSPFAQVPQHWVLSTGKFWDNGIDWVNVHFFPYIDAVRSLMFVYILKPTKDLVLNIPWLGAVVVVSVIGYCLEGGRLAILSALQVFVIAAVGLWPQAMVSIYLVGVSVFLACLFGIPIGIACAWNDRLNIAVKVVIDTLQTLPAFVYLIPVIMLFSVGEFSAIIAMFLYCIVPAIRFTAHGIRSIRRDLIEAPVMIGCSRLQIVGRVQLPLAMPEIMLGINQTLMMALSMLVITALVGTRDLGQETLIALSKVDPGRGLVAGICVALIATTSSRLITAWAESYRRGKGLTQ